MCTYCGKVLRSPLFPVKLEFQLLVFAGQLCVVVGSLKRTNHNQGCGPSAPFPSEVHMIVTLTLGYVVTECIYLSSGAGSRFGLFFSRSGMLATLLGTGVLRSWGRGWSVGSEMALWRQY